MRRIEIEAPNDDKLIDYIEFVVLPQLKEGYISGYQDPASWGIEGDEEFEEEED